MKLYAIYDPSKGKYAPHYSGSRSVPALYTSKTIASEVMERCKKHGMSWDARVTEVELKAK